MIKYKLFFALLFFSFLFAQEADKFVGSAKSDKYHYRSCRWAKKILDSNLVTFKDEKEAVKRGYVACKVCKPPIPKGIKKDKPVEAQKEKTKYKSKSTVSRQCMGTTKKGKRCKRKTKDPSGYCWQHK